MFASLREQQKSVKIILDNDIINIEKRYISDSETLILMLTETKSEIIELTNITVIPKKYIVLYFDYIIFGNTDFSLIIAAHINEYFKSVKFAAYIDTYLTNKIRTKEISEFAEYVNFVVDRGIISDNFNKYIKYILFYPKDIHLLSFKTFYYIYSVYSLIYVKNCDEINDNIYTYIKLFNKITNNIDIKKLLSNEYLSVFIYIQSKNMNPDIEENGKIPLKYKDILKNIVNDRFFEIVWDNILH